MIIIQLDNFISAVKHRSFTKEAQVKAVFVEARIHWLQPWGVSRCRRCMLRLSAGKGSSSRYGDGEIHLIVILEQQKDNSYEKWIAPAVLFSIVRPCAKRPQMGIGHQTPSAAALLYSEVSFVSYSFSSGIYFASLSSKDLRSILLAL